jgi:hypothetical protein
MRLNDSIQLPLFGCSVVWGLSCLSSANAYWDILKLAHSCLTWGSFSIQAFLGRQ